MRDLLFLCHRIPYPPDKGDKIRSFHILRHLSSRFRVHLGCFYDDADDKRFGEALGGFCASVFCLPLTGGQKAARAFAGLMLGKSMSEACYQDRSMHAWIRDVLRRHQINDVFVYCSAMAPYAAGFDEGKRIVIDMVDVDSEKWASYARSSGWPLNSLYGLERRRVLAMERRAGGSGEGILFVSRAEREVFAKLAPELAGRLEYMENGVDLERFDAYASYPSPFAPTDLPIVFTGAMNYRPNVDAVRWFAHEVFPAVGKRFAQAKFWIVGANPAPGVRRLAALPGVTVTGTVADVRPYLANALCAVAPLAIARGVQNKVLEAMAMARPVIATAEALEGLSAVAGTEVLRAEGAEGFVRCVSDVLSGGGRGIGQAARRRVEADYRWSEKFHVLDRLFGVAEGGATIVRPADITEKVPVMGAGR